MVDTFLYAGTPDSQLTYTGDDYIVWDRINGQRLSRGLPGLAAIGYPRPPDDSGEVTSSGDTVALAQSSRDLGAIIQTPQGLPGVVSSPIAIGGASNFDIGVNLPLRSLGQTQANPPPTASTPIARATTTAGVANDDGAATAPQSGGAGAPGDDSAEATNQVDEIVRLVNRTARAVTSQPNVLDLFASYTYSISLYLMSPDDYRRLIENKRRYVPGYLLMVQTGGAPQNSGIFPIGSAVAAELGIPLPAQGRNPHFSLDYYIDDLEIEQFVPGKGTNAAHNAARLKFKITEPNGITFIQQLNRAVEQYVTVGGGEDVSTANGQYSTQNYLMVIRWYGYDSQGRVVSPSQIPGFNLGGQKSDSRAIVEKFIPFQFEGIKFRVASKLVEYHCEAVAVNNQIATSQARGTIPFNIELSATTLQNLFNGNLTWEETRGPSAQEGRENTQNSSTTAPPKASAAPDPQFAMGLTQTLNKYQESLVADGIYTHPDIYRVIFSHPEMANASIVPPGETNRLAKPMTQATTGAQAKDGARQSVNNAAQNVSATAGQSIIQFIQQSVQRSEFILNQQKKIKIKDENGVEREVPQSNGALATAWFKINIEAKPRGSKYFDPKRNDYAYEITYEVAPYAINEMRSEYFPAGRFRGVQKRYPYWFTGENTAVLKYEQDFNYLYYLTVNSRQSPVTFNAAAAESVIAQPRKSYSPSSGQSTQGQKGNTYEGIANAADYLYSPGDQGQVSMTIIGDPAWIMQGTLWRGVWSTAAIDTSAVDVYFDPFLDDGTINFDAREVLFEIVFKKPTDYDLGRGLLKGLK